MKPPTAANQGREQPDDADRPSPKDGFGTGNLPVARASGQALPIKKYMIAGFAVAVLLAALMVIPQLLQKWLWMQQLDYSGIFWTLLSVKWGMACLAFIGAFVFLWINIRTAVASSFELHRSDTPSKAESLEKAREISVWGFAISGPVVFRALMLLAAGVAALFALGFYTQWDTYLRFRYGGTYGLSDPVFKVDVGFYLFTLPFYQLLQSSLVSLTLLALAAVATPYAYFEILRLSGGRQTSDWRNAIPHASVLLSILAAALGWGFYLERFNLLYSTRGVVYGVGYTDAHISMAALWIMIGMSAVACALLVLNIFRPQRKAIATGFMVYFSVYVLAVMIVPALVQKFMVQPSELALETPYLDRFIDFTRKAYKLDAIQETAYPALEDLTPTAIARNQGTIQNIRLWDARPLLQTYEQTQAIRLYYQFYHVDVDRYHLSDGYHQVMLSTRELSAELPAQARTWVNQNLQFTHGEGVVMNFVSKVSPGGFPEYLIDNVPPETAYNLKIEQPAIYYGEAPLGPKIVATGVKEFDYPKGNQNVYESYGGKGGIPLDSFGKRLLFAWTQADINILFTSYLKPESRIQLWRSVQERVAQVAPFLKLDADPYAVVSEGKQYWIQDAYTTSDRFPYSNPHSLGDGGGLNYIRNSVKVVVDMYEGSVSFYIMDPNDPVLAVYQRAFPGVFKDLKALSPDLKRHLRYPEDLFGIQANQYATFHMTDPQVFYNREDLWVPPQEKYDGKLAPMEPYYILMKLPGSEQLEFLIMSPYTPQNRDNMISWLAARCDFADDDSADSNYGKMLFYELPKEKLIYGPNQISAMIDQNTTISQQLTLWDQKGSGVIRGKLVVIPIENAFLYVVPLYLRAEGANFPQLKRVIAATGNKVVMEPTLNEALAALFTSPSTPQSPQQSPLRNTVLDQARGQIAEVQQAIDSLNRLLDKPTAGTALKAPLNAVPRK
jgi:uncharacterized membrane protein (UPF0182 family)